MANGSGNSEGVILIVDDGPTNRVLLKAILGKAGFETAECSDGKECLQYCNDQKPRMILLDVMMPELDGIETCRQLRFQFAKEELPIIMVTTKSEGVDLAAGLEAGANDYVNKPVDRKVLLARMENQLKLVDSLRKTKELETRLSQQQKMHTVGIFAAGVVHNFNNIMGGIRGAADLLSRSADGDKRIERCLSIIRRAVDSGVQLTDKMGTVVQRKMEEDLIEVRDLRSAVKTAILRAKVVPNPPEITNEIEEELFVAVAPSNLRDILDHILSNAVDAVEGDGTVRVYQQGEYEDFVHLVVEDTGHGMTKAVLKKVYEPFFSTKNLDEANAVSVEGNGLGLWSVYNLVKMAGGDITIESESGIGTTVTLVLPKESS